MTFDARALHELLPAVHRIRDAREAGQLEALFGLIAEPVAVLEEDLEQLYDDQFIETCAQWVVPYLGDLIGYRPVHGVVPQAMRARAEVANTIRMRRRKGTAAMLEQLARDTTGWDARVVEYFQWLAWTQYMQHLRVRPARGGTLSLRDHDACERITHAAGAFDTAAHTVDVRRIGGPQAGRHNIRNVGLFLWRLRSYWVAHSEAREVADGRYTFNPAGLDAPLFNRPRTEEHITHLAEEINVPGPLRRRPLYDELERLRDPTLPPTAGERFFSDPPVFQVTFDEEDDPIPPEEVLICDLGDWHVPQAQRTYTLPDGTAVTKKIRVAVDPVLGRLTLPADETVELLRVSCASGFPDDIGAGPYDRLRSVSAALDRPVSWQIGVSRELPAVPGQIVATLREAVAAWNAKPAGTVGVIAILDSRSYAENLTGEDKIEIKAGSRLLLVGADWPETAVAGTPGARARVIGNLAPEGVRPHLLGDVSVVGTATGAAVPGELIVNGLLLDGSLSVLVGNLGGLTLAHTTLVPGRGELAVSASAADADRRNAQLRLRLDHSITGPLLLADTRSRVQIFDSAVSNGEADDMTEAALDAVESVLDIERSTVLGTVRGAALEARNTLFLGKVETVRRQMGCVSFSYVPPDSLVPRRYRCQPDLESTLRIQAAEKRTGAPLAAAERAALRAEVAAAMVPTFTSVRYGSPAYCQLRDGAPLQIRAGADDEAEMGMYHDLYQPQRETNLRVRLDEYLRFGLQAGIFHVT